MSALDSNGGKDCVTEATQCTPRPKAMPWRRPFDIPTPSTIKLSGPGEAVMTMAATEIQ